MRRWLVILGAIVVLGLAYWAWPLVGAAQLARTARSGDAGQVFERVDVDGLRRSLARQIAAAYLDVSGKGKKMGAFGRSVAGLGRGLVMRTEPEAARALTLEIEAAGDIEDQRHIGGRCGFNGQLDHRAAVGGDAERHCARKRRDLICPGAGGVDDHARFEDVVPASNAPHARAALERIDRRGTDKFDPAAPRRAPP